jgi:hypothetical protein
MQKVYISIYALISRISRNESSVHGHESFNCGNAHLIFVLTF